jgi:2,4-dienoyl-CoA reductase (NADPH2)
MGKTYNSPGKAEKKKKVAVIGAGPSGMEAARTAALRGHDVTLYDKATKLGGLLPIAAVVKGTEVENLPELVKYYRHQLKNLGVKVKLGQEVTPATLAAEKPDAVIVAAGGAQAAPDIKGINSKNVVSNTALHKQLKSILRFTSPETVRSLTNFYLPIGKRVVVIGGALQGCELGEFFTRRGRQVTIIDTAERLGQGMVDAFQGYLFAWFKRKGVRMEAGVKNIEITDKGVSFTTKDGKKENLAADTVVAATPLVPNMALYESLKGKAPSVYAIGDCKEPLLIADAIGAGMEAARGI